jgi:acyl-CoA thioesterase I
MTLTYAVMRAGRKAIVLLGLALVAWAAPFTASAAERLVLAFGDSLTAGYQLPAADSYPVRLADALKAKGITARVHNAGVSGDTTTAARARLGWVLASLKGKPDLVILCLGGNDSLRGIDPKATRANMEAMLAELGKRRIRVLLVGMLAPPNMGSAYARDYNSIFPQLAKHHGSLYHPFMLQGVIAQPRLLLADGMHPNPAGVGVIVRNLLPLVLSALEKKS